MFTRLWLLVPRCQLLLPHQPPRANVRSSACSAAAMWSMTARPALGRCCSGSPLKDGSLRWRLPSLQRMFSLAIGASTRENSGRLTAFCMTYRPLRSAALPRVVPRLTPSKDRETCLPHNRQLPSSFSPRCCAQSPGRCLLDHRHPR